MIARREQIRELLRAARARIDPGEVGLRRTAGSRSPGLRREDVAVLAGVSLKWYSWLEQGRAINFSTDVVEKVCAVLRLSPEETQYLLALLRKPATPATQEGIVESFLRSVRHVPVPKFIMTLRWDLLAWNSLVARIFRDYSAIPLHERNLLRIVLTDKRYQSDPVCYEAMARELLGEFRIDFGRCAHDPRFEQLITELKEIAPQFERHWRNVEICKSIRGTLVQHDEFGDLSFYRISYVPDDAPLRVVMFVPRDPRTARVISRLQHTLRAEPTAGTDICDGDEPDILRHPSRAH